MKTYANLLEKISRNNYVVRSRRAWRRLMSGKFGTFWARFCMQLAGCTLLILFTSPLKGQDLVVSVSNNHRIYFPEGKGPFPTVIAIPGCSGVSLDGSSTDAGRSGDEADRLFRRHYARMAKRLQERGFVVVLIDYLTPEGVANTCAGEISHERVGEYIEAALDFVSTLAQVDDSSLFVIGWSHGGAGVIAWLEALRGQPPPATGAVAIYPECNSRGQWTSSIPVLILLGEADDIALPERCNQILDQLPKATNLKVCRYSGALHGFDLTEGPEALSIGGGMTVGRNQSAGEQAWDEIFSFLRMN
jgi:dienelactone hydrolase